MLRCPVHVHSTDMAPERSNQFKILLSDQELAVLKEVAEQRGVTASDLLRLYIREQGALLTPASHKLAVTEHIETTRRLTKLATPEAPGKLINRALKTKAKKKK